MYFFSLFFFNAPSPTLIYTLSLHDALPIYVPGLLLTHTGVGVLVGVSVGVGVAVGVLVRSEEHTSELQSRGDLVCRLLLENKKAGVIVGAGVICGLVVAAAVRSA